MAHTVLSFDQKTFEKAICVELLFLTLNSFKGKNGLNQIK